MGIKLKTYECSCFEEVEYYTQIKAKNKEEARKKFEKYLSTDPVPENFGESCVEISELIEEEKSTKTDISGSCKKKNK